MKFALSIIALGAAGFTAGFVTRESPVAAASSPTKAPSARIESVLRSGDSARAMESLRKLAGEDPRAFFKALEHFPRLDGVDELVELAARKLAAGNPDDAAMLLNQIPNLKLREAAWLGFVKELEGRTLLEKLAIARLAEPSSDAMVFEAVVRPGLETDPEGTLELLRRRETIVPYGRALGDYGKTQPAKAIDKLKADMARGLLKPRDGQWVLSNMAQQSQSPEVLGNIAGMLKGYGWGEGLYPGPIFSSAFEVAPSGQKGAVLDAVDGLLAVQKNFVLSQIPLASCPDTETALRVLNSMDSTELQVAALKQLNASGADPAMVAAIQAGIASQRTRELWQAQGHRPPEK